VEEQMVSPGCGYFASPLGLNLTNHICQVETTVRVPTSTLIDGFNGVHQRQRDALQEGDQLGDRGNTEDLDSCNEFASPACLT
jgi:hypothetical protein